MSSTKEVLDNKRASKIFLEKVSQLDYDFEKDDDNEEVEKAENNFELKKWGANVWSDIPELNKDFTMSNLSDTMFNSKVVNFIRNRILIVKLLRNIFPYAERDISNTKFVVREDIRRRIQFETIEYRKCRNLILSEIYTILNLSKARGGLVLKSFLEGGMSKEEMEAIVGEEGSPADGEKVKRSWIDRLLGRNKNKKKKSVSDY